jgi:hypothetical protein
VVSLTFLSNRNSDDPHLTSPWSGGSGGGTVKPHIRRDTSAGQTEDRELFDAVISSLRKRLVDNGLRAQRTTLFGSVVPNHCRIEDVDGVWVSQPGGVKTEIPTYS